MVYLIDFALVVTGFVAGGVFAIVNNTSVEKAISYIEAAEKSAKATLDRITAHKVN